MASGPVCRTQRPNTWLHRPICKREESSCQLGAVHTWHLADISFALQCPLSGVKRTWRLHCEMSANDPKRTLRQSGPFQCASLNRYDAVS